MKASPKTEFEKAFSNLLLTKSKTVADPFDLCKSAEDAAFSVL
jgi:hypothetical protein